MVVNRKDLRPYGEAHQETAPSLIGTWENELGSEMKIESFDGKAFSGTYTSTVSPGAGTVTGSLSGTLAGNAIAFSVNWESTYASVTAWCGLLLSSGETAVIYTLWHLASAPESGEDFWQSIQAGADVFVPTGE